MRVRLAVFLSLPAAKGRNALEKPDPARSPCEQRNSKGLSGDFHRRNRTGAAAGRQQSAPITRHVQFATLPGFFAICRP